ncbi:MAG: nucleotidyltransferase domain-containing protein [Acidobacteria bacterium]|nr:nucleotidyltransferase domain-containing protein [Acidobacteriota bacterium]
MDRIAEALARDSRIAYALLFGSVARGDLHAGSDLDIAIGLMPGARWSAREAGVLVSDLEQASGRTVDLVILDDAPPAVAYRAFRDGVPLLVADRRRMVEQKTRAILDYLDFRPLESIAARGALSAATRG